MTKPNALRIDPQPTDSTCGPTSLHAIYAAFGDEVPLAQVIEEIPPLPDGGTLGVGLACHALRRGYQATIYSYNLRMFDPTWFPNDGGLAKKLDAQRRARRTDEKLGLATEAYLEFLELGGDVHFEDLDRALLERLLGHGQPVLAGLAMTYLYRCSRETDDEYDDVGGTPTGHFVVLAGFGDDGNVQVLDPLADNPGFGSQAYAVSVDRLIGAVMLGALTWDANLVSITPPLSS